MQSVTNMRSTHLLIATLFWYARATCMYERDQVIECMKDNVARYDTDGDGRMSRSELEHLLGRLGWMERALAKSFGGVGRAMKSCDVNHDGYIDFEEIDQTKQCLTWCYLLEKIGNMVCET